MPCTHIGAQQQLVGVCFVDPELGHPFLWAPSIEPVDR